MKLLISFFSLCIITIFNFDNSIACTRAFFNTYPGAIVCGRTLDYFGPVDPSLVISPCGVARTGGDSEHVARWISRYGSVMIFADGVFPLDGINEKGLAAHTLFYAEDQSLEEEANQDKPVVESRAWLTYILDNFETVEDAVKAVENDVRLVAKHLPIDYASDTKHIAMEDSRGDSAIIEINHGKLIIYHGREYTVLTNPPSYDKHLENVNNYYKSSTKSFPGTPSATDRFIRAWSALKQLPKPGSKAQAQGFTLSVLNYVSMAINLTMPVEEKKFWDTYAQYSKFPEQNYGIGTYWYFLADISNLEYHIRSAFASSQVWLSLNEINFQSSEPVRVIEHMQNYGIMNLEGNILQYAKVKQ